MRGMDWNKMLYPDQSVPTAAIIGRIALIMAFVIELNFGWARQPPAKFLAVTAVAAIAIAYKLTWRKRHKVYDQPRPVLTNRQSWAVIALVVAFLALAGWLGMR
jgi:uncharacterized membrane protein AbrB (regulator of aidB expression)